MGNCMPLRRSFIPREIDAHSAAVLVKFQRTFRCSFEDFVKIVVPFTARVKTTGQIRIRWRTGSGVYMYEARMNSCGYLMEVLPDLYMSPVDADHMAEEITDIAKQYPESLPHVMKAADVLTAHLRTVRERRFAIIYPEPHDVQLSA